MTTSGRPAAAREARVPLRQQGGHGDSLFEPAFLRALDRLTLLAKRLFSGELAAVRREKGASVEFEDYRRYAPGDDLRYVDWHVFQRLDQLVVKQYRAEPELVLTLLVDASGSMGTGRPEKRRHAMRLAAALGYIALHLFNELRLVHLPYDPGDVVRGYRSKAQIFEFFTDLERRVTGGVSDPVRSLRHLLARHPGRGRAALISDLASPDGWTRAFGFLAVKRLPTDVLHIWSPDEADPPAGLDGDVRLLDAEGGPPLLAEVDRGVRSRYRAAWTAHVERQRRAALRARLVYRPAPVHVPFDRVVRGVLETGELLR